MTAPDDTRLYGRHPEFARPSLRPGIGQSAMHEVASQLMAFNLEESQGDVPSSLRIGKRVMPLGRYLRRELRKMVGHAPEAPQATLDAMAKQMRPLREAQMAYPGKKSFASVITEAADQAVLNMETRQRIYKGRKSL